MVNRIELSSIAWRYDFHDLAGDRGNAGSKGTQLTSEVNFDADGKHTGYLRLPRSVHRSAYGWIPIPIQMIKNGDGPTALLISANHGDEYEGQVALTKLCRELSPDQVRGRLIILTMANSPAALAGMRTSPIYEGNLNRVFPGDPRGTPTQAIAHYIEEVLMPMCDYVFDFHSGEVIDDKSIYELIRKTGTGAHVVLLAGIRDPALDPN